MYMYMYMYIVHKFVLSPFLSQKPADQRSGWSDHEANGDSEVSFYEVYSVYMYMYHVYIYNVHHSGPEIKAKLHVELHVPLWPLIPHSRLLI